MKSYQPVGKILLGILYISIALSLFAAIFFIVPLQKESSPKIFFGGEQIAVTIADTSALQEKGLSGHLPLSPNEGMLFIFANPGSYGFWMKDMLFPLDIIWFDKNYQVTDVWEDAQPSSYPEIRTPSKESQYVLEVSSGFFNMHQVHIGDKFQFI